jgi:spore coat protein U-like protein
MKKILFATAAVLVATPAFAADTDSDSFNINASVEQACTMQGISDINLGDLSVNTTAGSSALLINAVSGSTSNSFWLSCNDTNTMTLDADATLVGDRGLLPGDDAGFTNNINYGVSAVNYLNTGPLTQPRWHSNTGYANNGASRGAIHRQVTMQAAVRPEDNTLRPVAGNYTANVTVTVTTI